MPQRWPLFARVHTPDLLPHLSFPCAHIRVVCIQPAQQEHCASMVDRISTDRPTEKATDHARRGDNYRRGNNYRRNDNYQGNDDYYQDDDYRRNDYHGGQYESNSGGITTTAGLLRLGVVKGSSNKMTVDPRTFVTATSAWMIEGDPATVIAVTITDDHTTRGPTRHDCSSNTSDNKCPSH